MDCWMTAQIHDIFASLNTKLNVNTRQMCAGGCVEGIWFQLGKERGDREEGVDEEDEEKEMKAEDKKDGVKEEKDVWDGGK